MARGRHVPPQLVFSTTLRKTLGKIRKIRKKDSTELYHSIWSPDSPMQPRFQIDSGNASYCSQIATHCETGSPLLSETLDFQILEHLQNEINSTQYHQLKSSSHRRRRRLPSAEREVGKVREV